MKQPPQAKRLAEPDSLPPPGDMPGDIPEDVALIQQDTFLQTVAQPCGVADALEAAKAFDVEADTVSSGNAPSSTSRETIGHGFHIVVKDDQGTDPWSPTVMAAYEHSYGKALAISDGTHFLEECYVESSIVRAAIAPISLYGREHSTHLASFTAYVTPSLQAEAKRLNQCLTPERMQAIVYDVSAANVAPTIFMEDMGLYVHELDANYREAMQQVMDLTEEKALLVQKWDARLEYEEQEKAKRAVASELQASRIIELDRLKVRYAALQEEMRKLDSQSKSEKSAARELKQERARLEESYGARQEQLKRKMQTRLEGERAAWQETVY